MLLPWVIVTVHIMEEVRNGDTVIRVDGWLEGEEEAAELLRFVRLSSNSMAVDLENLFSADRHGIAALRSLVSDGFRLRGASDFIKLLLGAIDERSPGTSSQTGDPP